MTIGQIRRSLFAIGKKRKKETIELAHRVEFMGRNVSGELEAGTISVQASCDMDMTVEAFASRLRSIALRQLQNEGYYEVFIGRIFA